MRSYRIMQLAGTVLLVTLFGAWIAYAAPIKQEFLNNQIDATNFAVGNPTFCSATLIDAEKGLLLTANHCIRDQFETVNRETIGDDGVVKSEKVRIAKPGLVSQLTFKDGDVVVRTDYTFKIIQNDADTDLALIQVKGVLPGIQQAPVACKASIRGDKVYAVGNSYGVLYASLSMGMVASTDRSAALLHIEQSNDTQFVQHTATAVGGNSGGALLNEAGELVGVHVRGNGAGIGLATPLNDVKKIIRKHMGEELWQKRCDKPADK